MRPFRSVSGKLSVVLLTLLLPVGLLLGALSLYTTRTYFREVNQHLNRPLASQLAAHLLTHHLLRFDARTQSLTRAEIKQSMVLNPDIEIYILDPKGHILDYSAARGEVQSQSVSLTPLLRFLGGVGPLPIYGDDPRHPGQGKIFSAARIPPPSASGPPNQIQGFIYIILGGQGYDTAAGTHERSYIVRWSLQSLAGVLLLTAGVGALLFRFLTRRLRRLAHSMEAFGARHFDGDFADDTSGNDEIERLERMFAHMAARIEAQIRGLQQADVYRREAVSNVSHDLRTPLAALQGYLETLQIKEGSLSEQERRDYIATATRHAQRLSKLVGELFDLARLESNTVELRLEAFSLAELVQDVAQGFALRAQQKGVELEVVLEDARPFVRGDIGLIERAMENIMDNALRHTPAGGRVQIALMPDQERARVRVVDTGQGIAAGEVAHIFDRYYRAPHMAGQEGPSGAGLGLAITRRIVELHGGTIEAHSALGQGATFTFSLPLASGSAPAPRS